MSELCKRNFEVNQTIHLVDYWGTSNGSQAFKAQAKILMVNKENETFTAVLYGDTYQQYSFKDYGRLIFDTAAEAANKLPKPQSVIYQKLGQRVYKKTVLGIYGHYIDDVYDLFIRLDKGNNISTKKIGVSIFTNEADARQK